MTDFELVTRHAIYPPGNANHLIGTAVVDNCKVTVYNLQNKPVKCFSLLSWEAMIELGKWNVEPPLPWDNDDETMSRGDKYGIKAR